MDGAFVGLLVDVRIARVKCAAIVDGFDLGGGESDNIIANTTMLRHVANNNAIVTIVARERHYLLSIDSAFARDFGRAAN